MARPRLLAYIFIGDLFVNAEIVRRGMASADVRPPNVKHREHIIAAQTEAKNAGIGIWQSLPNARFIGNKESKKFHKPDCKHAAGISPRNRIPFDDRDAAKDQRYRPCEICKP
ncbi:MAG: hypothetical protein A2Z34_10030 [Planctomycetes bacterium RBG_16_59_8]|nr:MAG: hypothetical protein A2Z34_10030 [Planctomycetes bacterium RBG_16_59_8]